MSTIRIKFVKNESVKFISHLDMMKTFQRAIRRARLNAEYSQGFNPQMQMVFGAPLSLGYTSEAEYADFTFAKDYRPVDVLKKMEKVLPVGLKIIDAGIRSNKKNIMSDIRYAQYSFDVESVVSIEKIAEKIVESDKLEVTKTRKGKTKTLDIRPLVIKAVEKDNKLYVLLKAGNQQNLNPRLLMIAVRRYIADDAAGKNFHRIEQYVERDGEKVLPLSEKALNTK